MFSTLPPWANGSSHEFVRLNREALESEYVSEHLNEWIDLIWGYKQKGEAAVEACNVFYYLTYSDVVDVLAIEDPLARQSALSQKVNFGQMPEQLFKKPHPKRIGKEAALASPNTGACMAEEFTLLNSKVLSAPVACTFANKKEVVFVCDDGFYCGNSIVPLSASPSSSSSHLATSPELPLLKLEMDKVVFLPPLLSPNQAGSLVPQQKLDQLVRLPSIDGISLQEAVAYSPELKLLFVGGSWDGTVRIHNLAGRVARSVPVSSDVVTTVAYDRGFLVTGSRDCTVHIYNLSSLIKSPGLLFKFTPQTDVFSQRLRMTISGHQFPIHLVALSEDFDIVLVASHGTRPRCTVHTLRTATFLREIKVSAPVDAAFVSTEGDIVLYSSSNATLVTFSVNCEKIVSLSLPPAPRRSPPPMAVSSSGKYIAMATTETAVSVYNTHNLKLVSEFNTPETITSLAFVCSDNGIVATLENTSIVGFNLMRHGF